jgi:benzoate-CoA ligase family protein
MSGHSLPGQYNAAVDLVDRHVALGRGAKVAFRDDSGALTYAAFAERVNRAGNALRALGVRMEERVLLVLEDSARFPVVFFGAIKIGAVPVPVNTLLTTEDYAWLLRDSRARALVVSAALLDRVGPALAGQPFLEHVLVDGEPGAHERLEGLLERASPELEPAPTRPDDVAFWLYTSGSTGHYKGAIHAQSSLACTADLYGKNVLGIREDDVVYSAAKCFFAYGLGNSLTFPLSVGATTVLRRERPTVPGVFRWLAETRPTIFCGVPTLFAAMLAERELPAGGALRVATSAGEALPEEVGRRFRERTGVDILDGLGSTEMLHIYLSNHPGKVRYGTTGTPIPGYELELRDESGARLGPGAVGDLWVSGPSAALGYWNQRELSRRTFQGRWTRTGDHYRVDEAGYWIYQGRSDDMLKVGGIYVSPFEVEGALVTHPAVLEVAVVGATDENDLVKPRALVVLKDAGQGSPALAEELKLHVKARLAHYKYPRWVEFVRELPKTATGKIQRFKLRPR